jgi:ATP-dependent Clp protease ATP-binding subunit ClpA
VRTRLAEDARRSVFRAANNEVRRLGDQRVGTQHLLLALLHDADSLAQRILGVDLEAARAALTDLDRQALLSIGVDSPGLDRPAETRARRKPPFTSGFRSVMVDAVTQARSDKSHVVGDEHLLRALLAVKNPNPAAALLKALGVDTAEAIRELGAD